MSIVCLRLRPSPGFTRYVVAFVTSLSRVELRENCPFVTVAEGRRGGGAALLPDPRTPCMTRHQDLGSSKTLAFISHFFFFLSFSFSTSFFFRHRKWWFCYYCYYLFFNHMYFFFLFCILFILVSIPFYRRLHFLSSSYVPASAFLSCLVSSRLASPHLVSFSRR